MWIAFRSKHSDLEKLHHDASVVRKRDLFSTVTLFVKQLQQNKITYLSSLGSTKDPRTEEAAFDKENNYLLVAQQAILAAGVCRNLTVADQFSAAAHLFYKPDTVFELVSGSSYRLYKNLEVMLLAVMLLMENNKFTIVLEQSRQTC